VDKEKINHWIPTFYNHSPMFDDCRRLIKNRQGPQWPDCNELNVLWPSKNTTQSGFITRFVDQDNVHFNGKYYEEYIHECGEIPTRSKNWHDFFNTMVWLQFPKIKSLINALHVEEMTLQKEWQNQSPQRTRKRDALTLFDESGVIFVTTTDQNGLDLQEHQWKKLFYENKNAWHKAWGDQTPENQTNRGQTMAAFIFGHGLYEKALAPYIGMTGNALIYKAPESFFQQNRQAQIVELDKNLSENIIADDLLQQPACLTPLPLLGIPGWYSENVEKSFYENENYFRPKREIKREIK
jgi:hypothetical protein